MTPSFLVAGPPRTGTTWLYRAIQHHPQIYASSHKEIDYFNRNFDKGLEWYLNFFKDAPPTTKVVGEFTPNYFTDPVACTRIAKQLGKDTKIYIIYRDPVERLISDYRTRSRSNKVSGTLKNAITTYPILIENSLYGKHLQSYVSQFPLENLYILHFQKMLSDSEAYLKNFYQTLDVSLEPASILVPKIGVSKSQLRYKRLIKMSIAFRQNLEKSRIGRRIVWRLRDLGITNKFHNFTSKKPDSIAQDELLILKEEILHRYFAQDLELFWSLAKQIDKAR